MKPENFTDNKNGRLIKASQGYWAFIPHPLPPRLDPSWELMKFLSDADRALSELAGVAQTLPNPHLLIQPFIHREAVLSSRIEGTQASLSDLLFFEASGNFDPQVPDVQEVANYIVALEYGLKRLTDFPISLRLIREMHAHLMKGVRGDHMTPGEFRRSQNWIGSGGCTLMDATFVPPPVHEMHEALGDLEKFFHTPSDLPSLIRLALMHQQFETIHPFLDGNGRIGRLLITLLLCAEKLLPMPLLYLSAYFERNRQEYYDRLLAVNQKGQWQEWISFFLKGVAEESRDAINRSNQLLKLWHKYRKEVQSVRSSALQLDLVDELFAFPAITIAKASRKLKITPRAAQLNVDKLIQAGILEEATGKQRYRIFIAPKIIKVIEGEFEK